MVTANDYQPNLVTFRNIVSALDSVMTRSKVANDLGITYRQFNYYLCGRYPVPFTTHFYLLALLKKNKIMDRVPGL